MGLRILKLILCVLALLVVDGCAKRETKTIGAGGNDGKKDSAGSSAGAGGGAEAEAEAQEEEIGADDKEGSDDAPSNGKGENDTYPDGLSKSEYEEGKTYIGGWTGLEDEPDSSGKWTLKAMPNPDSFSDSLAGEPNSAGGGVALAEVRPIIQNACANCHSPNGSRAVSPLVTDEQVMRQMDAIKSRVRNGSMPPSGGLAPEQKDLIARWTRSSDNSARNEAFQQGPQQQQPDLRGNGTRPGYGGL